MHDIRYTVFITDNDRFVVSTDCRRASNRDFSINYENYVVMLTDNIASGILDKYRFSDKYRLDNLVLFYRNANHYTQRSVRDDSLTSNGLLKCHSPLDSITSEPNAS